MDLDRNSIKSLIVQNKVRDFVELLNSGLDPNFEGGWLIRLAARHGSFSIVKNLLQFGANPHLLGESGASTLQLAVFSGNHWDTDEWTFLMSCCDSSQLADGAAVAVIFQNIAALKKILATGRCNTNIPTTLTGKTLEQLAKGYKLSHLLSMPTIQEPDDSSPAHAPRQPRQNRPKGKIRSTCNRRKCMKRCMNVDEAKEVCKDRSLWDTECQGRSDASAGSPKFITFGGKIFQSNSGTSGIDFASKGGRGFVANHTAAHINDDRYFEHLTVGILISDILNDQGVCHHRFKKSVLTISEL